MKKLIIAAVILLFIAVIYVSALCKTAGDADRQAEMMHARRMRELEGK